MFGAQRHRRDAGLGRMKSHDIGQCLVAEANLAQSEDRSNYPVLEATHGVDRHPSAGTFSGDARLAGS
jgi:hypothetical protein